MDQAAWILAVLCVVLTSALVWSLLSRARADRESVRQSHDAQAERARADRAQADLDRERARASDLGVELARRESELDAVRQKHQAELEHMDRLHAEREASIERARQGLEQRITELNERFEQRFEQVAGAALEKTEARLIERATRDLEARRSAIEGLVRPIGQTLEKAHEGLLRLGEQVELSKGLSESLRDETGRLVRALSRPEVRGQYGEIQLRRVAELAGMTAYCDFDEQSSVRDAEGRLQRPDMVVHLPNECTIAVDAKTNTYAYLEAVNASDAGEQERHLERFARHVADQAQALGRKGYWSHFEGSPEFVVMFVPGDHFIDAALSRRPDLIDTAASAGVILASPSTLIGLLRAVAVGWREQRLAEEARELLALGTELHERAAVAFAHAEKLGSSIRQVVDHYNSFVGSVDARLRPTLRRFEEAGAGSSKQLSALPALASSPRTLTPDAGDPGEQSEGDTR